MRREHVETMRKEIANQERRFGKLPSSREVEKQATEACKVADRNLKSHEKERGGERR